ncbi:MAG: coenzyme F420-0:L-glutamate ligase [Candidatus Bathyarchaeota archaeon]|nr:MAG: coenzyme F420-0:L-glutamate ligase [Candidatus Bathyarchaeota archaeon]
MRPTLLIQIFPVNGLPVIKEGDKLSELICRAMENQGSRFEDGDIIVITHVVVSRSEGSTVNLHDVEASAFAKTIAAKTEKDPALVEVILREAQSIIRMRDGALITQTKHGFICANSGVDQSNVPGEGTVALLPEDADASARRIQRNIEKKTGKKLGVIVSDTHGRPLRDGEINVAIGVAGLEPIRDRRGDSDLFGYVLKAKRTAIADEIASAAELAIGQADEAVPVAIVRGYPYIRSNKATAKKMLRPLEQEYFI